MIESILGVSKRGRADGSAFLGEIPASEFITGDALATAIGLTAGISQHSDAGWLKFYDGADDTIKYIAKKPLRHSISWNQINDANAVYGDRIININGLPFRVRLLKGANSDPTTAATFSFDHPATHGSEWNRLLYRISGHPFSDASNTLTSEGITEGDWAQYSETDLVTHYIWGTGSYCWCQEVQGGNRVGRGNWGVSSLYLNPASHFNSSSGWRPILELIGSEDQVLPVDELVYSTDFIEGVSVYKTTYIETGE